MMSRLVTSGCSCTRHCWPTWADYLGRHYDNHINVAVSGGDNAVIARNVMSTAQAGDTVAIMWTGFDRFSIFSDDVTQRADCPGDFCLIEQSGMTADKLKGGWHHRGTLLFNPDLKSFFKHFYHPVERFRQTLDYVKMVQMHGQLMGYRVWNFSMANWFIGESEAEVDARLVEMHNKMKFRHFYLDQNLLDFKAGFDNIKVSHKYAKSDSHPTPLAHWAWLKEHMAPEIGISLDFAIEDQVKLDQERVLKGDVD